MYYKKITDITTVVCVLNYLDKEIV